MDAFAFVEPCGENTGYLVTSSWPVDQKPTLLTSFSVTITDLKSSWSAKMEESLLSMLRPSGIDEESFALFTFAAFHPGLNYSTNDGISFLTATLNDDGSHLTLYWKLKQKQGFQVILGSLKLVKTDIFEHSCLTKLISDTNRSKSTLTETENIAQNLGEEIKKLSAKIKAIENGNQAREDKIFVRFKDILNAKKRKIKQLMTGQSIVITHGDKTKEETDNDDELTEMED